MFVTSTVSTLVVGEIVIHIQLHELLLHLRKLGLFLMDWIPMVIVGDVSRLSIFSHACILTLIFPI
tara:strand:- start:321 stop:518 length:198 start_codon:yes stop_codon:yes gene_type:complete